VVTYTAYFCLEVGRCPFKIYVAHVYYDVLFSIIAMETSSSFRLYEFLTATMGLQNSRESVKYFDRVNSTF
jgi:hypothetical protein